MDRRAEFGETQPLIISIAKRAPTGIHSDFAEYVYFDRSSDWRNRIFGVCTGAFLIKRMSLAGLVLAALCSVSLQAAHAEAKAFATPPDRGKQTWFLGMLKTLADTDALGGPVKVGAILGVKFNKVVVTSGPSHMEAFAKSFERDEYAPIAPTWFTGGPVGDADEALRPREF